MKQNVLPIFYSNKLSALKLEQFTLNCSITTLPKFINK